MRMKYKSMMVILYLLSRVPYVETEFQVFNHISLYMYKVTYVEMKSKDFNRTPTTNEICYGLIRTK